MVVRPATIDDLGPITDIYNDAIRTTVATFDTEPKSPDEQKSWFDAHGIHYPIIVAESDGAVIGWASLSQYSARCAYSDTAEASVYVAEHHQGRGVGRMLLSELMQRGAQAKLHTVIARIAGGNETSVHLFEAHGFEHVGVLKEVGCKFGRRIDVYIMQRIFNP